MLFLSSSLLSPPPSTSSAYSLYTARRQWSQRARERAAGRHSRRDGQGKVGRGTQKDWRGGIKCIAVSPTVAPSGPLRFTMGRKEARLHTANHTERRAPSRRKRTAGRRRRERCHDIFFVQVASRARLSFSLFLCGHSTGVAGGSLGCGAALPSGSAASSRRLEDARSALVIMPPLFALCC